MTIVGRYVMLIYLYTLKQTFVYLFNFPYLFNLIHKLVFLSCRLEGAPSSTDLMSRLQTIIERNEINLIQARRDR